jgi:hypothetical protein
MTFLFLGLPTNDGLSRLGFAEKMGERCRKYEAHF